MRSIAFVSALVLVAGLALAGGHPSLPSQPRHPTLGGPGTAASSGTQPDAVSGLVLWFKADDGPCTDTAGTTPCSSDGDAVARWTDKSSTGFHPIQATAGNKPEYKTAQVNGKPALRFANASTKNLQTSGTLDIWGANDDYTLIHVLKTGTFGGSPDGYETVWDYSHANDLLYHWVFMTQFGDYNPVAAGFRDTADNMHFSNGLDLSSGAWTIATSRKSGTTLTDWKNGVANTNATAGSSDMKTGAKYLTIGAVKDTGYGRGFSGDIAELIAYNNAISTADRQGVEDYLSSKYNISVTH